jgi:uncharacterized protein (TIGR00369 family)
MSPEDHFRRLERMYLGAPTNVYYRPSIEIGRGVAKITIEARPDFFHAASAVHGGVYFKLLDDTGFFAANSLVEDFMVLTANLTIHLLRPVSAGALVGTATVVHTGARQFLATSAVHGPGDTLLAHGVATYVRSKIALGPELGYK